MSGPQTINRENGFNDLTISIQTNLIPQGLTQQQRSTQSCFLGFDWNLWRIECDFKRGLSCFSCRLTEPNRAAVQNVSRFFQTLFSINETPEADEETAPLLGTPDLYTVEDENI